MGNGSVPDSGPSGLYQRSPWAIIVALTALALFAWLGGAYAWDARHGRASRACRSSKKNRCAVHGSSNI